MSNEVNTTPLGEPMWEGEVTYSMAQMICNGLERIKPENLEAVMKRFAFEWIAARQENAQLRAERDLLRQNHPFGAIYDALQNSQADNATLRDERDELERKGKELCCAYGNALITIHDLRAALARMQGPVSMEEMPVGTTFSQVQVNALIAARAAGKK